MNSIQYEELCRYFLSKEAEIPIDKIISLRIPNPKRGDLPQYSHQIDLFWETGDNVCTYLNIANAKWRSSEKVDQRDVLLLQQVKQKVSAHKAVMITNTEFTSGAQAAAKDEGIALHIVQPSFNASVLDAKDRIQIQSKLQEAASLNSQIIFEHIVVHKAFELGTSTSPVVPQRQAALPSYPTKVVNNYANKSISGYTNKGGATGGNPVGGATGSPFTKGGGGFHTK